MQTKQQKPSSELSQSGAGVHEIKWSFDKASQTHSAQTSVEDKLMILQDLRVVSGRCHAHFPDIAISATANLDVGELFT